jgi:hypothetical protein
MPAGVPAALSLLLPVSRATFSSLRLPMQGRPNPPVYLPIPDCHTRLQLWGDSPFHLLG